jgi:alpha-beta hydrolase superfamily lysophospholipase/SAM-dependent methyltransferase
MIEVETSPNRATSFRQTEHTLALPDGGELFYRVWLPSMRAKKALLLFHRGHEHSARWQQTVEALALDDVAVFAWDARGHGRSSGERGSAVNLSMLVKDVDDFVRHVSERYGIATEDMIVMAHSVGAVIVAAWVHDYAPPIRALILATPAFRVKLYFPFAVTLLRLRQKLLGPGYVKSYVKARMLTHDLEEARRYQDDEFIFRQIAVNVLLDLHDTSTRLLSDAGAITVPTLMVSAGSDWVVKLGAQQKFLEGLSSHSKQLLIFRGFHHAVFHEKDRRRLIAVLREFMLKQFQRPNGHASLLDADEHGYTRAEYDCLRRERRVSYAAMRFALKTVGRLSAGIRLGWRTGFDSGMTLDYVYDNRPQGVTPLGCSIDRAYLNSIGWRGIRQRRNHLQKTLRNAILATHAAGRPVRIFDVASGPGRYILQTMQELRHIPITAVLCDYKTENLDAARRLARELGLENVITLQGDAFDRASLAAAVPRSTIGIVSGLYELFPGNRQVLESLYGLADAIEPEGHLIYTNQPWHPQLNFIAGVLTNREGKPWRMRRRTQAEMDELVRAAGFVKSSQEIDRWGIFTVSAARRIRT